MSHREIETPSAWLLHLLARKAWLLVVLTTIIGGGWLALHYESASSKRASSTATPLKVGTNVWPGTEPLYLAKSLELFRPEEIRLVEYSSATQVLRSLRNQTIDAATLTLDEALRLNAAGLEIRAILVMDVSNGADAILARSDITSMSALKGQRIGVESTAVGAFVLSRALQLAHLAASDISVVPLEVDEHEDAISKGQVDAVVTFEPARSRLLALGLNEVFDSSNIPDEIVDVLVVRRKTLSSHPKQLKLLLKTWFEALDYIEREPSDAVERMAPRMQTTPAALAQAYERIRLLDHEENVKMLAGPEPLLNQTAKRLNQTMLSLGLLTAPPDSTGIASPEILLSLGGAVSNTGRALDNTAGTLE